MTRKIHERVDRKKDRDYYDYLLIKEVFDESKGAYVYRRICEGLLIKYGVIFNHKKVARIMQKYGLKPEYIKRLRPNFLVDFLQYYKIKKQEKVNSSSCSSLCSFYFS